MWTFDITPVSCCIVAGDRYDEAPRKTTSDSNLGEIDDWNDGKKSVVDEAVDKGKDIWNRIRGRGGPDETVDYRFGEHCFVCGIATGLFLIRGGGCCNVTWKELWNRVCRPFFNSMRFCPCFYVLSNLLKT